MEEKRMEVKRIASKQYRTGNPVVPWMPDPALRSAMIAMKHLESKFNRINREGVKLVDREVSRVRRIAEKEAYINSAISVDERFFEKRRAVMLEKSKKAAKVRLMKKAGKLQDKIDDLSQAFYNMRMFKEAA